MMVGDASASMPEMNATDLGNARRMVHAHGTDLRYCAARGGWRVWDGRRWVTDQTGEVMRRAKCTATDILAEAAQEKNESRRHELAKHALASEREGALRAMVSLAESEPGVPMQSGELDADPWLLNVLNGTLDLRSFELRAHDRRDHITRLCPVEFHPRARLAEWERFLRDATGGDDEFAAFLQRAAGYSLTGDTREEKLFFLYGEQASGKSTFVEAIKAILGDYSATANFDTLLRRRESGPRNDIARLVGTRFVSCVEVDEGQRFAEGLVKQITGGDTITARLLYRENFEYKPTFKLWLAANHAPRVSDGDEGMWRRVLRVPFTNSIPPERRDPRVKALLTDANRSGPAILAWAIAGCAAWQEHGLGVPEAVARSTSAYREEMDHVREFLDDRCVVERSAHVAFASLYSAYSQWCRQAGEQLLSTRSFGDRLTKGGISPRFGQGN
jgi:putative DNA primase/helicase